MSFFKKLVGATPSEDGDAARRTIQCNSATNAELFVNNEISNTKYTPLTFLPKNAYEQFSLHINRYFLLIACLQLYSVITPVNPISTWFPLIVIFLVSAVKEALDDYYRHVRDKEANERLYKVYRDGQVQDVQAQSILVGEVVVLGEDEEVPCDLVLLKSSDPAGACYIQTANLDGETDLKARIALPDTARMTDDQVQSFRGTIECAAPNPEVYRFDSRLRLTQDGENLSLSSAQMLLQATHVRNTTKVWGVAVYTGNETKLGKNKSIAPFKRAQIDETINKITIFIFVFQLGLTIIFGVVGNQWKESLGEKSSYLRYELNELSVWPIIIPLRFMLLMSLMIPISLKVTLDFCKFFYALCINWDLQMYDENSGVPAVASNTAISEDLGQIKYVFTDKTGTLTENIMAFKKCSIGGVVYGNSLEANEALADPQLVQDIDADVSNVRDFFRTLAACHTVVPSQGPDDSLLYKASSPDEEALVKAAASAGFTFCARGTDWFQIDVQGTKEKFELLQVLEFSSERKRMSVLARNSATGTIRLFSKGADDVIFALLSKSEGAHEDTRAHLETFAQMGLRTLCVAVRDVPDSEYEAWATRYKEAKTAIEDRDAKLAHVYEMLEKDLILLGVTAIEDRLQDQVPETIQLLRDAGLVFWMLTGDKYSTAVQIATSCRLMSPAPQGELLKISGTEEQDVQISLEYQLNTARSHKSEITVIVEGPTLAIVLEHHAPMFLELALLSKAVICCRVTPAQKASVVGLVKDKDYMTLAIGDGGNDVSMIQQAHVGVGIAGREGLQAARAADYSFARFRFLARLMLIHGRYSYHRTAYIAQYSFYKSLIFCFIQIAYAFVSAFSGVSFFDSFAITAYNVFFTGLPVMFYALDKDVSEEAVMLHPQLYRDGQTNRFLNVKTFMAWAFRAFLQALIIFGFTISIFNHEWLHPHTADPMDYAPLSVVSYTALIMLQTFTMALETNSFTIYNSVIIWGTMVFYYIIMALYSQVSFLAFYRVMDFLYADVNFWFSTIIIVAVCLIPFISIKYYFFEYHPLPSEVVRKKSLYTEYGREIEMRAPSSSSESSRTELLKPSGLSSPIADRRRY